MLSRVAENLYWIARYVERAENVARLMDDAFQLELDAGVSGEGLPRPLESVLTILACREQYQKTHKPLVRDEIIRFLTFERRGEASVWAMISRARENVRGTQETLSSEVWSQLNRYYLYLSSARAHERFRSSPFRFFERIKCECTLFSGLVDSTLPRTEVFHFLQVGRYLERVDMLSRILNVHCHAQATNTWAADRLDRGGIITAAPRLVHWMSLLRSCSAYEAYLKQAHDQVDPSGVLRYLMLEDGFPRAIRHSVVRCLESLRAIAGGVGYGFGSEAERRLGRLESDLRYMDINDLFNRGISPFLISVQDLCNQIGQDIQQAYFMT